MRFSVAAVRSVLSLAVVATLLLASVPFACGADPAQPNRAAAALVEEDQKSGEAIDKEELARLAKTDPQALFNKLMPLGVICQAEGNTGLLSVTTHGFEAGDDTIALLDRLDNIGELTLNCEKCTEECLETIVKFKRLHRLWIGPFAVSAEGMKKLATLPKLDSLTLLKCDQISDEALETLQQFKSLEHLTLGGPIDQIDEQGFQHLAACSSLKSLQIGGDSVTDEALRCLAKSKSLSVLALNQAAFSDAGLQILAGMENLRELALGSDNITTEGIRHLQAAAHLESLQLTGCAALDDDSLAAVGELINLRSLALSRGSMTDDGLVHLNGLINLENLSLMNGEFTGAGLKSLPALTKLTHLDVMGENAGNELFAQLHQFPLLQVLQTGAGGPTDNPKITDEGLKSIGKVPRLGTIILTGTGVTDAGLESLAALPNLQTVFCHWSTGTKTMIWNAATQRKRQLTRQQAASPQATTERQKLIAQLRGQGAQCEVDQESGQLDVVFKGNEATDAKLELLARIGSVNALTINRGQITAAGFESIARLTDLTMLTLEETIPSEADLTKIAALPLLKRLQIRNGAISDEKAATLKTSQALAHLHILGRNNRLGPGGFEQLAAMPMLNDLSVVGDTISDEALQKLASSRTLAALSLEADEFSVAGLQSLAQMKPLRSLSLRKGNVSAVAIRQLKTALHLDSLGLWNCAPLNDDLLIAVGELTNLQGLGLESSDLTDDGLAHLNSLVKLRRLNLSSERLTGAGLESLSALSELTELNVGGKQVTDVVFAHLNQFPNLDTMRTGVGRGTEHPGITDEGLKLIGTGTKLRELYIEGSAITQQGLDQLQSVPSLNNAYVFDSPGVRNWHWEKKPSPR